MALESPSARRSRKRLTFSHSCTRHSALTLSCHKASRYALKYFSHLLCTSVVINCHYQMFQNCIFVHQERNKNKKKQVVESRTIFSYFFFPFQALFVILWRHTADKIASGSQALNEYCVYSMNELDKVWMVRKLKMWKRWNFKDSWWLYWCCGLWGWKVKRKFVRKCAFVMFLKDTKGRIAGEN